MRSYLDTNKPNGFSQDDSLRAAQMYARGGWSVLPVHRPTIDGGCSCSNSNCHNQGKHPRTRHGFNDATTDDAQIVDWFGQKWPDANIGVATRRASNLIVLDVDPRNGGEDSLRRLVEDHRPLPDTPEVATGGSGTHIYFSYSSERTLIRASALDSTHYPGIDLPRFVVAPPSAHASGRRYEWKDGRSPDDLPLAELPEWLVPIMKDRESIGRAPRNRVRADDPGYVTAQERTKFRDRWRKLGISLDANARHYTCIFHSEDQPSLWIDPVDCQYKCYGSGCVANKLEDIVDLAWRTSVSVSPVSNYFPSSITDNTDIDWFSDLLGHGAPEFRCQTVHLWQKKLNPTEHRVTKVLCQRWLCGVCGPFVKRRWLEEVGSRILMSDAVYCEAIPDFIGKAEQSREWERVRKKIRRADGNFVRLVDKDGTYHIIADVDTGDRVSIRFSDPSQAVHALWFHLMMAPFDTKRVTTSRGWKLRGSQRRKSDWARVTALADDLDETLMVIKAHELKTENGGWAQSPWTEFSVPKSWLQQGIPYNQFVQALKRPKHYLKSLKGRMRFSKSLYDNLKSKTLRRKRVQTNTVEAASTVTGSSLRPGTHPDHEDPMHASTKFPAELNSKVSHVNYVMSGTDEGNNRREVRCWIAARTAIPPEV